MGNEHVPVKIVSHPSPLSHHARHRAEHLDTPAYPQSAIQATGRGNPAPFPRARGGGGLSPLPTRGTRPAGGPHEGTAPRQSARAPAISPRASLASSKGQRLSTSRVSRPHPPPLARPSCHLQSTP